jgi:oligoribonuclease
VNLAFVDNETTGLCPKTDRLLEVGIVIVELPQFRILEEAAVQFRYDLSRPHGYIHPKVVEMHHKNGLWDDCLKPGAYDDYQKADEDLCQFLLANGCQGAPLAGANPSFDRGFMRSMLPKFEGLFHYRNLDTNSFWLLEEMLVGEGNGTRVKNSRHRAVDDCKMAIRAVERHVEFMMELVKDAK